MISTGELGRGVCRSTVDLSSGSNGSIGWESFKGRDTGNVSLQKRCTRRSAEQWGSGYPATVISAQAIGKLGVDDLLKRNCKGDICHEPYELRSDSTRVPGVSNLEPRT